MVVGMLCLADVHLSLAIWQLNWCKDAFAWCLLAGISGATSLAPTCLQGRGKYGALGLGDFENRSVPTLVRSLAGVAIRQVSCGDDHTALLAEDGTVYTMGR